MIEKAKLRKSVWENKAYYKKAREGSLDTSHPGMKILINLCKKAEDMLDLGCGEGTRLNLLVGKKKAIGVDISGTAIGMAKKNYPRLKFIRADLEKLPFKNGSFDLVYSAYVLEHLSNPKKVIDEALRVIKKQGNLVLIAPNYGAPNRASPPFKGSRIKKFVKGFLSDLKNIFTVSESMIWTKISPIANSKGYEMDWDVTIEPYLGTLVKYLRFKGLRIVKYISCWDQEFPGAKVHQGFFRVLGKIGIYPFTLWGPHLVVVVQKR